MTPIRWVNMDKPKIDPEKLLAFLRQLHADLKYIEDKLDNAVPWPEAEVSEKLDEILSDVGDQVLLLPEELKRGSQKKPSKSDLRKAYKKGHPRA